MIDPGLVERVDEHEVGGDAAAQRRRGGPDDRGPLARGVRGSDDKTPSGPVTHDAWAGAAATVTGLAYS